MNTIENTDKKHVLMENYKENAYLRKNVIFAMIIPLGNVAQKCLYYAQECGFTQCPFHNTNVHKIIIHIALSLAKYVYFISLQHVIKANSN